MRNIRTSLRTGPALKGRFHGALDAVWDAVSKTVVPSWHDGRRDLYNGHIYVTSMAALPPADEAALFQTAILDLPVQGGIKLRPLLLWVTKTPNNTRAWLPTCPQVLLSGGGNDANPYLSFTAVAATGVIGKICTIPGTLFSTAGMQLEIDAMFACGATAVGSKAVAIQAGGVVIGAPSGNLASNANSVQWCKAAMWLRTPTTQSCTYTLAPNGVAANSAANTAPGINTGNDFDIEAAFSGATVGDIIQVVSATLTVK